MRKLLIRPQARLDLIEIWHYIAQNSTANADRAVARLEAAIRRLAELPGIGHCRSDVRHVDFRFWAVHSYVIAYRVDEEMLIVVRVVHGRRNFRKLFRKTR